MLSNLPLQGHYCVVEQTDRGMRHYWHDSLDDVQTRITALDTKGSTVFVAQATFKELGDTFSGRKRANAAFVRCFFMDIDCGANKPYPSQAEGAKALKVFCEKIDLPMPSVISSGNGLYGVWTLTDDVPAGMWVTDASIFQQVVKAVEPGLDGDGIMADSARILRPVGATHRKDPTNPKTVRLLLNAPEVDYTDMMGKVRAAAEKFKVKLSKPSEPSVNAQFMVEQDKVPSHAPVIAQKCRQIAHIAHTKGNVPEPLWYAAVGLLRHTVESPEIIHEWSEGHPDYSEEKTDAKIRQHESADIGPTTCNVFSRLSDLCVGCTHASKITSPIQLGKEAPKPLSADSDELPEDIKEAVGTLSKVGGYTVSKTGVCFQENDSGTITIYPHPVLILAVNADHFGESVTVQHHLPHEGWEEFSIQSSKVTDQKAFFAALLDNHIHIVGKESKSHFMSYFELMMQKVRGQQKISRLATAMGWQGIDGALKFAHGNETYHRDGQTVKSAYSASAPDFIKALVPRGTDSEWVEMTKVLNQEGMEGFAFEFLCAAFGAPLVRFTGFEGAMVSVVGDSGIGKTVTGKWGLSAWGHPDKLALMRDDTRNAFLARMGAYGSLPAYIDEVSNIDAEELSELVYRITQGREKLRLDKSAKEKKTTNTWNTLAVVSSNQSLMDKLSVLKGDASAELNRVFEYEVYEGFDKTTGARIARLSQENYAIVGKTYAKYLTENQDKHRDALEKISYHIDLKAKAEPGERFWTMIGAVAIYGGMIAKKLGISHVEVERLIPWVCECINNMRQYKQSTVFEPISWLGSFMDRHASEFIMVSSYNPDNKWDASAYREPKARLLGRIEEDKQRMWISIDALKRDLRQEHISYTKLMNLLLSTRGGGVLVNHKARCTLGRGTIYSSVVQRCWEFDLNHPELGRKAISAIKHREEESKKKGVKR